MLAGDVTDTLEQLHARRADAVGPDPHVHRATLEQILRHCAEHPTVFLPSHDPDSAGRLRESVTVEVTGAASAAAAPPASQEAGSAGAPFRPQPAPQASVPPATARSPERGSVNHTFLPSPECSTPQLRDIA